MAQSVGDATIDHVKVLLLSMMKKLLKNVEHNYPPVPNIIRRKKKF
jgi:hypothetical protein